MSPVRIEQIDIRDFRGFPGELVPPINVAHGQRSCLLSTRTAETRVRSLFQVVDFFLPSFRSFRPSHWPEPYSVAIQQKHSGDCSRRLCVDKVAQFI
jgi:hypothetical protein